MLFTIFKFPTLINCKPRMMEKNQYEQKKKNHNIVASLTNLRKILVFNVTISTVFQKDAVIWHSFRLYGVEMNEGFTFMSMNRTTNRF